MTEPNVTQIFGAGAAISNNNLVIPLANFPRLDLPNSNLANQGEKVVVGLLLLLLANLPQSAYDADIDRSVYAQQGDPSYNYRGTDAVRYKLDSILFYLAKLDSNNLIDPDDYAPNS